ncbi:NADH-quinone oxidoreductase subunit M [Oceanicella sp. SM1341]|uniref:NADH-quinone oxidoreductase subunit M n=1 Tax=Oceanicella sp. SM1341 TaxID=1548889 RepID=UPI000E49350D|nr:NADH-quinone oxidoreductase subunit M [Oceanicella sp. SM1341]
MGSLPILSIITFLPLIGAAVLLLLLRGNDEMAVRNAKWLALLTTLATFVLSLALLFGFDSADTGFQFVEEAAWLGPLKYQMGVDGISVLLVMLTTFLMPMVIACSWHVENRVKEYMIAFLVLEALMVGVFCALDVVLFYLFFEASLIPMFLIIGIWGGKEKVYASFKYFLYTLFGSVLMLIAIAAMYADAGTTDIRLLLQHDFSHEPIDLWGWHIVGGVQLLMWWGFFVSFAVKMPMFPVHTWLADAHVQAPTAGSVVLAAILLKVGGYGFLRFCLPMFPVASDMMQDFVFLLSVIAIVYASLVAMVQEDMKKLIAYSSVAHMGFVTLGIFAGNQQGVDGSLFLMLSHGFISGGLFLCVGVLYDRMHTRDIDAYGGLVIRMPVYALTFMLFTLGNAGLPGTSGFVGEFLTLLGAYQANSWAAFGAATGVVLSACYTLWLYRRVMFGDLIKQSLSQITDMSTREKAIFAPLIIATIVLGVYPSLVIDIFGPSVTALLHSYDTALADAATQLAGN